MMLLDRVESLPSLVGLMQPLYLLLTSLQLGIEVLVFSLKLLFLMVQALGVLFELL